MSNSPPVLTEAIVLDRLSYLVKVGVLGTGLGLDARGWLSNFAAGGEEHAYAVNLLGSFLYLPTPVFEAVFVAAVHALSAEVAAPPDRRGGWNTFINQMIVTPVQDVRDQPASSGYAHARMAKAILRVPEEQIRFGDEAAERAALEPALPIVFVDDFVGTGEQFVTTWHKEFLIQKPEVKTTSFATLAAAGCGRYYYCPALATPRGLATIAELAPEVTVSPGTILDARHDAFHPESVLWPAEFREGAEEFLRGASERAGIPDDSDSTSYWRGYRGQGLAIGFERGTPDATLPIFTWEENGWKPFLRAKA